MFQKKIPLYQAMKEHFEKDPVSFHVPGHKYGNIFPEFAESNYREILKLDATELTGLDDLHDPTTVIQEAQELLADLYHVKKSYFLINGSTVGNLAMILAVCNRNDIVLVQRNCHKSILNGLQLAGARPVFLSPAYDSHVNVPTYVPFDTIKKAIEHFPEAKALILTNPNYYGMSIDLTKVVALAHHFAIPVLVDEAHGAHFIAGHPFPKAAVCCGADIVVNSAHKTLPAMTMGSYLHYNSKLVDEGRLSYYLHALQSSSPSYPIMISLDLARYYLAGLKKDHILTISEEIEQFKESLRTIEQIQIAESNDKEIMMDILKLTVQSNCSLSGYQLQSLFEEQNIFTELADPFNILCVLPLSEGQDYEQIALKMKKALKTYKKLEQPKKLKHSLMESDYSYSPICYDDIIRNPRKVVHLKDSIGKLSAQMIVPYPPGIPLLMLGEQITDNHIEHVIELLQSGAKIQGISLIEQDKIEVFDV